MLPREGFWPEVTWTIPFLVKYDRDLGRSWVQVGKRSSRGLVVWYVALSVFICIGPGNQCPFPALPAHRRHIDENTPSFVNNPVLLRGSTGKWCSDENS